jgi:hypothetical protein
MNGMTVSTSVYVPTYMVNHSRVSLLLSRKARSNGDLNYAREVDNFLRDSAVLVEYCLRRWDEEAVDGAE